MSTDTLPDTPRGRLRWALHESLVIAGVLLFWVGLALAVSLAAALLRVVLARLPVRELRLLVDLLQRLDFLWPGLTSVATAAVGLYVVVRAGTLLIDHYRTTAG